MQRIDFEQRRQIFAAKPPINSFYLTIAHARMPKTESSPRRRNAVFDTLIDQFEVFRNAQPLALGIHKEILVRMPEINRTQLQSAMRMHAASTRYLKQLLTTKARVDLDGKPAGEVTEEQRGVASATLKERFNKLADKRRMDQKAQTETQQERAASQQRQEKLAQLATHFGRR